MYRASRIKVLLPPPEGTLRAGGRERGVLSHRRRMARINGLWAMLSVVEFMSLRFRWAGSKTRRRLDALVELGVLRCTRDLADNWTKVFEVVDRPHVPAAFAVELGA